jgi:aldehyde dehydrogenase (NAD+)
MWVDMTANVEKVKSWIAAPHGFYIAGEWTSIPGTSEYKVFNPADESVLGTLNEANHTVVDNAVAAAREAFPLWSGAKRKVRAEALKKIGQLIRDNAEELAVIETLTNGKTFKESLIDDMPESADVFDYYAGWADKYYGLSVPVDPPFINYTVNDPLGVVGLIVPWNFPMLLACWKIAPALITGNTVVIKPASFTSHSMIRLFELIHEAKILPKGVMNLVLGDQIAGEALSNHKGINKISFTGSTNTGRKVVHGSAASNLKAITLELGGKSPNILFEDTAHLPKVIQRAYDAMFSHKGEKCSEPTRLLVHESIYDTVVAKLVEIAGTVKVGDPFDPKTGQGPQCHRAHYNSILKYIEQGKKEGATLLTGGAPAPGPNGKGFYIQPTIFGDVKTSMTIAQDEIFGPVLCVIKFKTEDEAVAIANDTTYGLAAGLYTADAARSQRVARKLDAGMVFVNHYGCYDFASPFGGTKQSGWGREMAIHSLSEYTKTKSIWMRY